VRRNNLANTIASLEAKLASVLELPEASIPRP